jgi:hypothetical protein
MENQNKIFSDELCFDMVPRLEEKIENSITPMELKSK